MMKGSKIKLKIPYHAIYLMLPYTLSTLFHIVLETGMENTDLFLYTLLIGSGVGLCILFPMLLLIMGSLSGIGLILWNHYAPENTKAFLSWIWQFLWNILQHIQGKGAILEENTIPLWMLLVAVICIYTHMVIFKVKRPLLLGPVYYSFFIYYWHIYINPSYRAMVMFTFLLILLVALQRFQEEERQFQYGVWMKTAIAYGLVAILCGIVLPEAESKVYWPWLENKVYTYFPIIEDMREVNGGASATGEGSYSIFSLQETGFNPNGSKLGGPVKQNSREVMAVKAPYPVYLRGRVSETYSNNQWTTGKWNSHRQWINRNIPTEVEIEDVLEISITYTNLSSNTLFTHYLPLSITGINGKTIFADENNQVLAPSGIDQNESYRVVSLRSGAESLGMERKMVRSHYLQLPDTISRRVHDLSKSITKDVVGIYEKAFAIEAYLQKNYAYRLDVPHIPEGEEFVEYFLFEKQEGYCTYFATAMVVLLRTQGIPSRYIEGYRMPRESNQGVYTITQKDAHAWVEAYIEGKGWITLDPTPAEGGAYTHHSLEDTNTYEEEEVFSDELNPEDALAVLDGNGEDLEMESTIGLEEEGSIGKDGGNGIPQFIERAKKYAIWIVLLTLVLWGLLKAGIAYYGRRKYERYVKGLPTQDQIVYEYHRILKVLEDMGHIRNMGETPWEFAQRISSRIYEAEIDFQQITHLFLKAKYSATDIKEDEVTLLLDYLNGLESRAKVKLGRRKYFYYKYFSNHWSNLIKLQKG